MRYNSIRKERRRLYIPSCIYWPFIQCLKTTKPRGTVVVLCAQTTAPNHIPISNRKSCKMYFAEKKWLSNERMQWIFWSPQSAKIFGIFKKNLSLGVRSPWLCALQTFPDMSSLFWPRSLVHVVQRITNTVHNFEFRIYHLLQLLQNRFFLHVEYYLFSILWVTSPPFKALFAFFELHTRLFVWLACSNSFPVEQSWLAL